MDSGVSNCQGEKSMKAAFFEEHGGPEVMKYGEVPDPAAGPNDVLVDIHAACVNGADWKVPVRSPQGLAAQPQ